MLVASRSKRISLSWWLLVAIAAILGADWLFPVQGQLSIGLTLAVTVLFVPWTFQVLRKERQPAQNLPGLVQAPARGSVWFHLGSILLALGFLLAKWLLLYHSNASHSDFVGSSRTYTLTLALVMAFGLAGRGLRSSRLLAAASAHPARLVAFSFGSAGVIGALVLSLPMSVETMQSVSLVDNLFMAFSSVCVTGLAVANVPETYTLFGEIVICALIQIGGLGIMVLSAALAMAAGQRLRVKSSAMLAQMVDATSLASLRRTVTVICLYTLAFEAGGAFLLYERFQAYPEILRRAGHDMAGPGSVLWASVFHAISAFCNAGMSNVNAGLRPFSSDQGIQLVTGSLVIAGGMGFPVLDELGRAFITKLRRRRVPMLSLNTRVALLTSAIFFLALGVFYLVLEWERSLAPLSYGDRVSAAFFQSAAARTAGFNVIDVAQMGPPAVMLTCAAMFVGASPGSTGGGIKTTTLAALFAGLRAELRAEPPTLLNRRLPDAVIRKAIGVAFLSIVIVTAGFFLLLLFEPHPPLELALETASAFSTTGLSMGLTAHLSVPGKLLVGCMMFIGRIGPLTLALAISRKPEERALGLPEERVLIG